MFLYSGLLFFARLTVLFGGCIFCFSGLLCCLCMMQHRSGQASQSSQFSQLRFFSVWAGRQASVAAWQALLCSKFRRELLGPCRPSPFAPPRHCPAAGRQRPGLKRLQRRPSKKTCLTALRNLHNITASLGLVRQLHQAVPNKMKLLAHGWMTKGWIPSRCSCDSCNLAFLLSSASGLPPSIQPNLLAHLPGCCLIWGLTAGFCHLKKSRGISGRFHVQLWSMSLRFAT